MIFVIKTENASWLELSEGKHEIFVSLKLKGKTQIQSTGIIEVDTTAMTMETIPGNRAVTTGKPDRKEEKNNVIKDDELNDDDWCCCVNWRTYWIWRSQFV